MADIMCVMGSCKHAELFLIFYGLLSHFTAIWNSKYIQELLAGRVNHVISPGFEH